MGLAAADPEAVRAAWSGLGYYRRATLMMAAARSIVEHHGGRMWLERSDRTGCTFSFSLPIRGLPDAG